jgi:hypothetical protein
VTKKLVASHGHPRHVLTHPPPLLGFKYRWIRAEINGFEDKQNVYGRMREGYELVRNEDLPEEYRNTMPTIEEGRNTGVVSVGGLLLALIPEETIARA